MIPKIIHYCWFGGGPKSENMLKCIASWKEFCPDYEIREWTEKECDINCLPYVKEAYEAKAWGFVPDYLRLWIIYNHGGIYLDTDVQIIRSLDPLLENESFMGFERGAKNFVAAGLGFGAEKGSKVIKFLMEQYHDMHFLNEDGTYNRTPAPIYTTERLDSMGLDRTTGDKVQHLDGMTIYPAEYFCPKDFSTFEIYATENTYSIHHFDASWFNKDEKLHHRKVLILNALINHNKSNEDYRALITPWEPASKMFARASRFSLVFLFYNLSRYSYFWASFLFRIYHALRSLVRKDDEECLK